MTSCGVSFPRTRAEAVAMRAWYETKVLDAYQKYEAARKALLQARGELAVLESVARGEFDDSDLDGDEWGIGSAGPWRVAAGARGIWNGWAT